jgi:hypothetical protein
LRTRTTRRGGWGEATFDGVDDSVVLPDLLDNAPRLSLSLWMRTPLVDTRQALVTKSTDYVSSTPGWYLAVHPTNVLELWVVTDNDNYYGVHGTRTLTDGLWHHVVVDIHDWGTMELWVDGLTDTISATYAPGTVTTISTTAPVRFGTFDNGLHPLQGGMDDLRLYNSVLTPEDTQTLWQASRQSYRGLLAEDAVLARAPAVSPRRRGPGLFFQ